MWGPGKSTFTFSVTFRFPLPARLQWLEPAGGKWKSANVEWKTYTLIYPDPTVYKNTQTKDIKVKYKNAYFGMSWFREERVGFVRQKFNYIV